MLLSLAQWLQSLAPEYGFFRVFQYITFRAVMAAMTALLIGLNSAGIFFSRRRIPDPAGMVLKNGAFLVLAWVAAAMMVRSAAT